MKIVAISDIHGFLPDIPPCDIFLLGGDVCPLDNHSVSHQKKWTKKDFKSWLEHIPAKHICWIAGNHDFYFQGSKHVIHTMAPHIHYLQDQSIDIDGIKIFGTPWTPVFGGWAFMKHDIDLYSNFSKIPEGTDIILSHGPAYGYCDTIMQWNDITPLGSRTLLTEIKRVNPKYVISGHIHSADHNWQIINNLNQNTKFICVSYVDEKYIPAYNLLEFDY